MMQLSTGALQHSLFQRVVDCLGGGDTEKDQHAVRTWKRHVCCEKGCEKGVLCEKGCENGVL